MSSSFEGNETWRRSLSLGQVLGAFKEYNAYILDDIVKKKTDF